MATTRKTTTKKVPAEKKDEATPDWYALLESAIEDPGELLALNRCFHRYSLSNRMLAAHQLRALNVPLQPINTFKGWLEAGRPVKKGEHRTVALIRPVPIRRKPEDGAPEGEKGEIAFTLFKMQLGWFHMGQTEGADYEEPEFDVNAWNLDAALSFLELFREEFQHTSVCDTRLGYFKGKTVAVSPLDPYPVFGYLREMAHVLLDHGAEPDATAHAGDDTALSDIEAEITAYLAAASLGLDGMAASRARIQASLAVGGLRRIPEKSAIRAFRVADKLVNAGYC